ncbi:MAG: hypothetical protein HY537_13620 [Deltaproteobacteria bacterium]|nr:hypothetical protein [Deltaproteobacteria bacterium]
MLIRSAKFSKSASNLAHRSQCFVSRQKGCAMFDSVFDLSVPWLDNQIFNEQYVLTISVVYRFKAE